MVLPADFTHGFTLSFSDKAQYPSSGPERYGVRADFALRHLVAIGAVCSSDWGKEGEQITMAVFHVTGGSSRANYMGVVF